MDLNENGSLMALEHLMEEFFNPITSNARKHTIESHLNSFKDTPQLSKLCLYFITNTSSQYVTMFALSTLESVINQQWSRISWSDKEEIKNVLYGYLIEKGNASPHFIRGKYAKLLVDIAKHDWPTRYPNFFNNILELLKSEPNQLIGLILLRTMSEEFMGLNVSFSRKEETTRLLQPYIPVMFDLLTNILDNLGTKPRHTSTATPPPSPTHPSAAPDLAQQLASATFRPDGKALNREALNTVQHLFTWVPVDRIPPRIIASIFNFTNILSYAQDDDDMCVLAMSTINELLYRKCTPPGSQDFFIQLFHHTVDMLRDIVHSNTRIDSLDPAFIEKLSELLVLLIEQHLWRLELEQNFSALDFLSLLFQLTMKLPSIPCYLRCIAVWAAFIKQIKPQNSHKYSEVFHGLVTSLLTKYQFAYNSNQLSQINNYDMDDDNETEWQIFLNSTIEIIAMITEYAPIDTFNQVLIPWKSAHDVYRRMEIAVDHTNYTLIYEISETDRLCYVLRDFSSLTQTLVRLSSVFIDQDNNEIIKSSVPVINCLIEKLIESASIANSIKFYNLKMGDSRLTDCFVDIHSQILAAIKTLMIWMMQISKLPNHNLKVLIDFTVPILHDGTTAPSKIAHAAAHLLLSITNLVFPPDLMVVPMVVQFVHVAPSLKFTDKRTSHVVNSAVTNLLLKSWGEINSEDANQRTVLINLFFDNLTREFRELNPGTSEIRVREVTEKVLPSLSHVVDFCKDYANSSKKLLVAAIKSTFDHALILFPIYVKYVEPSNHILNFFINVLSTLQQQLGVDSVKNAVETFLQVAISNQQSNSLAGLDKLLQILQIVVEAPGTAYKSFLPGILQLCMENVYPVVCNQINDSPEVFISLLTLLYSILLHRWQYFYISQVRLGYSPGCSESEIGPDAPQKPEQLLAVINVFGQALVQEDINIFRFSLAALEDLNNKWKLYHKMLFKQALAYNFLNVLIKTLIDKRHDLLAEDIQIAVYNMASVDLSVFFKFLEHFVQNIDGVDTQQGQVLLRNIVCNHDKDMPTFVQYLQRFVSEAQHFRLCNRTSRVM